MAVRRGLGGNGVECGSNEDLTGKALAEATQHGGEFSYEQGEELVRDRFRKTGSEEFLVAYLKGFAERSNLEAVLPLVDLIADPRKREAILDESRVEEEVED
ncbi:MAG: hypothetical protein EOP85_23805 [Verrucomicrobiaceae bacterium]|nr:MAG: hypothetical protein EOP85_23805 [Verrucomicrobiaceae bacterium]